MIPALVNIADFQPLIKHILIQRTSQYQASSPVGDDARRTKIAITRELDIFASMDTFALRSYSRHQ